MTLERLREIDSRPAPAWTSRPTVVGLGVHSLTIQTGARLGTLVLLADVAARGHWFVQGSLAAIDLDGTAEICWSDGLDLPPYTVRLRLLDGLSEKVSPDIVLTHVGPVAPPPPALQVWLTRYLLFVALPFTVGLAATTLLLRRRKRASP